MFYLRFNEIVENVINETKVIKHLATRYKYKIEL